MIGCIADDYTGATDVASAFRRGGLSVALAFGTPSDGGALPETDVTVIGLKTRTIAADRAVAESLAAWRWLRGCGATRAFFKVCSTFDSTDAGNIGPVADALTDAAPGDPGGAGRLDLVCPAAPRHGRTVYQGHLFVGDRLLSESSMRHHPLTPMTDSDLVRVLGRQTLHGVGLVDHATVRAGSRAAAERIAELGADGTRHLVADAVSDEDLLVLATAAAQQPGVALLTGAAGLAEAMARTEAQGRPAGEEDAPPLPDGPTVVLTGSCSHATLAQVSRARDAMLAHRLDAASPRMAADAVAFVERNAGAPALLVASAFEPDDCRDAATVAAPIEEALAQAARAALASGARRIVVAGGETSGAVVRGLGIGPVLVGSEEAPGVPWIVTPDGRLALLLKSGNFGEPDLFLRAAGLSS